MSQIIICKMLKKDNNFFFIILFKKKKKIQYLYVLAQIVLFVYVILFTYEYFLKHTRTLYYVVGDTV